MSKKHKKVPTALNYTDDFLILASIITGYISVSFFASFIEIPIKITIPAIELKICAITEAIKKYKSIIKDTIKYNKIILLARTKLNSIEVFRFLRLSKISKISKSIQILVMMNLI